MREQRFGPGNFEDFGLPEDEVYSGFWSFERRGHRDTCFGVKHLDFRVLVSTQLAATKDWFLDQRKLRRRKGLVRTWG
jgi:hypothetical protein